MLLMRPATALSEATRVLFEDLIERRTGMSFGFRRTDDLERAVISTAASAQIGSLIDYYNVLLHKSTDDELWVALIAELTIGETYFFRNSGHFDALRHEIFPALLRRRQDDRRLRIWSAGCSSGEEAYSIAMLLSEMIPDINDWRITIVATDINRSALHRAAEAEYREWSMRQLDDVQKNRYFNRIGDTYQLRPDIRRMVSLGYLNLAEETYPSIATNTSALDLILCRNVAIYFSLPAIRAMATRFGRCLLPGGWLLPGAAETNQEIYADFGARFFPGAVVYQKDADKRTAIDIGQEGPKRLRASRGPATDVSLESLECGSEAPSTNRKMEESYKQVLVDIGSGNDHAALIRLMELDRDGIADIQALALLARLLANAGDLDKARMCCHKALQHDPLCDDVQFTLALVSRQEGDDQEALRRLRKALYLNQDFALAHHTMAVVLRRRGRNRQARRHSARARWLLSTMNEGQVLHGSIRLTAGELSNMLKELE